MSYKSDLLEHYKQVRRRLQGPGLKPVVRISRQTAGVSGPTGLVPPSEPIQAPAEPVDSTHGYPKAEPLPGLDLSDTGERRWKRILIAVANKHHVDPDEVLSPSRSQPLVKARMEAVYRIRTELNYSYPQISKYFSRDHATILHSMRSYYKTHIDGKLKSEHSVQA